MKKFFLTIFFVLGVISSYAALPPFFQSSKEIKSILNDQRTYEKLTSGDLILEVKKVEGGWMVTTNHHELFVEVNYIPPQHPGPVEFDLLFHDPVEINKSDVF